MPEETRYLHKPCGEHVLTKRDGPWRPGDILLREDVLWRFKESFEPMSCPACLKCSKPVEMTDRTENGIVPEAEWDG